MLNGKSVKIGDVVKFTMFSNWTFNQGSEHEVTSVSNMCKDGWFNIKVKGFKDWHCCLKFSLINLKESV